MPTNIPAQMSSVMPPMIQTHIPTQMPSLKRAMIRTQSPTQMPIIVSFTFGIWVGTSNSIGIIECFMLGIWVGIITVSRLALGLGKESASLWVTSNTKSHSNPKKCKHYALKDAASHLNPKRILKPSLMLTHIPTQMQA